VLALGLYQRLLALVVEAEVEALLELLHSHRVVLLQVPLVLLQLVVLGALEEYLLFQV
jgi:hypothetical protein